VRKARCVRFVAPGRVEVGEVALPDPGPGDVVVRTLWSGISSGTEMLAYRGQLDPDLPLDERLGTLGGCFSFPFRYGYSCVGLVEHSDGSLPAGSLVFAFHPHQESFVASVGDVVPLPEATDPRLATLFPLVETALQLRLDAGRVHVEPVVVLGLGVVGLLTALLVQRAGGQVVAGEPLAWRRDLAASLGISAVAPEEAPKRVRDLSAGRGAPLVVELSGVPAALASGLDLLAHEGTALVGSWYGTRPVALPLGGAFHRRRLTIRSSQVSTIPAALADRWDVDRRRSVARDLLAELPLRALATTAFAFHDAPIAYEAIDRAEPGVLHAALRYE
jgi:2-desacetyl-2-hydroxyethyl bacteriochlorophyllide A dehydrogenase